MAPYRLGKDLYQLDIIVYNIQYIQITQEVTLLRTNDPMKNGVQS